MSVASVEGWVIVGIALLVVVLFVRDDGGDDEYDGLYYASGRATHSHWQQLTKP